jgi:hypothetical protein
MKGPLAGCVSFVHDRKNHRPARRCYGLLLAKLPPWRSLTGAAGDSLAIASDPDPHIDNPALRGAHAPLYIP